MSDKERDARFNPAEPDGSYGLCWKHLVPEDPGSLRCVLEPGHGDACSEKGRDHPTRAAEHARRAMDASGVLLAELACVEGTADPVTAREVAALRKRLLVLCGHIAHELIPLMESA